MRHLLLLALAITVASCNDDIETPDCILDYSDEFATRACPGSGDLTIWNFDGENVFCFAEGECLDSPAAEIYDDNCRLLCILGGADGENFCQGLEWATNASLQETVLEY
jgi:hypothetical protein